MKYRIRKTSAGYFAQVRGWFLWHTIGSHPGNEFGLYSNKHNNYPLTLKAAQKLIDSYDTWINEDKTESFISVEANNG